MKAVILALTLALTAACGPIYPAALLPARIEMARTSGLFLGDPRHIQGRSHEWALEPLVAFAKSRGVEVSFDGTGGMTHDRLAGAYSREWNVIFINLDISTNFQVSTLAHEIAHSMLEPKIGVETAEVLAEAIAFFVMQKIGLDTAVESLKYIARYPADIRDRVLTFRDREIEEKSTAIAAFILPYRPKVQPHGSSAH